MNKIICFGELLLRFSPDTNGNWLTKNSLPVFVGGAELNVATALACWQLPVAYCTALPANTVAEHLHNYIRGKGIDNSLIHLGGSRVGTYYISQGSDLKSAAVIYDRAHSSFSQLKPGVIDWDKVLDGAKWFHFTAISPAINETIAAVCEEALQAAVAKKITVSLDLNYRARLWQYGKKPVDIMPELVQYCDVIMGNIWSANTLLGIPVEETIHDKGSKAAYLDHASFTAKELMKAYPRCKAVANTFRFDRGNGIHYFAALNTAEQQYTSPEFDKDAVVDKSGSGDCFMAGLIYGLYHQHNYQRVVSYAAAAAFGKLQEKGDCTSQTTVDVNRLLQEGRMINNL